MDNYHQSFNTTENAAITTTKVKDTLQKVALSLQKFLLTTQKRHENNWKKCTHSNSNAF